MGTMSVSIQIKDFAYQDEDPRHFGIYDEDSDAEESSWDEIEGEVSLLDQNDAPKLVRAVSLYVFEPENGNELALEPNQVIYVNDSTEFGGWLVAYNIDTGATGLVPSQYVTIVSEEEEEDDELSLSEQVQGIAITATSEDGAS